MDNPAKSKQIKVVLEIPKTIKSSPAKLMVGGKDILHSIKKKKKEEIVGRI